MLFQDPNEKLCLLLITGYVTACQVHVTVWSDL